MRIPKSRNYSRNVRKCNGEAYPCVVCGKPCPTPGAMVECVGGGCDECVMPGAANTNDPGYMGSFPVGPDCLRKHPELAPYATAIR